MKMSMQQWHMDEDEAEDVAGDNTYKIWKTNRLLEQDLEEEEVSKMLDVIDVEIKVISLENVIVQSSRQ